MEKRIETREKIFSYMQNHGWECDEYGGLQKVFYGGYKGMINPLGLRRFHIREIEINGGYFLEAYFGPDVYTRISLEHPTLLPGYPETMDVPAIAEAFNARINKYAEHTKKS